MRMDSNVIFRAAKCLACSHLVSGHRVLSALQQASVLLKPPSTSTFSTARTQLFASSAASSPAMGQPSLTARSGVVKGVLAPQTGPSLSCLSGQTPTSLLPVSSPVFVPARGRAQVYYRPSAWKRVNKHGMDKRLRSPGGIEVLWRRILKKRHCLTPFDRILPGAYNGQILPEHHLKYNQHLVSRQVRKKVKEAMGRK